MSESEQIFEKMLSEAGIPTTEAGMRGRWDTINAEEGSQITNNSAWSPFWRLVSAIVTAPALWLVRLLVRHALPNTFLKFATGTYLDIYCWGVDLERHPATYAEGTVLFTRAEASGNLTIPKGTIIESPAIAGVTHRVATLRDARPSLKANWGLKSTCGRNRPEPPPTWGRGTTRSCPSPCPAS